MGSWNFNSGDGEILYDHSGNQNHGTINGPTWSEDVYVPPTPPVLGGNNSLIFDGVDDLVQLSQDAFSGETGTLMAWFKPKLNLDNAFDSGKSIYCHGCKHNNICYLWSWFKAKFNLVRNWGKWPLEIK